MDGADAWGAEHRLASYGTLGPGRANHHHVSGIRGRWFTGTVRARLIDQGWGATMGFPALVLDPTGSEVEVQVLESPEQLDRRHCPPWSRCCCSPLAQSPDPPDSPGSW